MTNQQLFNTVAVHLLTQNRRAMLPFETGVTGCRYRAQIGNHMLKCAVGCLIPDHVYVDRVEGLSVSTLMYPPETYRLNNPNAEYDMDVGERLLHLTAALVAAGVKERQLPLLQRLQEMHDTYPVKEWPVALAELAQSMRLNYLVVTRFRKGERS